MWLAIILTILIIILCLRDCLKPKNYPPGPRWLPILGCVWTLEKLRRDVKYLHLAAVRLAEQYGPVVGLKVGKDLIVVCNDLSSVKAIFTCDEFNGRPHGIFYRIRTWGIRRGVLLTDREFWQEQRRFVLRHLKEFGYGKDYMAKISENEAEQIKKVLGAKIDQNCGAVVLEMRKLFGIHVINTLWVILASIRYSEDDKDIRFLQAILTRLFENIDMIGTKFSHFPILRYLAPEVSGYKMFLETHQQLWKFLNNELQKHKETYKQYDLRDFMDSYLEELTNANRKESFSETQLLAICLDLFIAGSETTNKTLEFMFLYLLLVPEVQKRAQEEIDNVIGRDRLPSLSDRSQMPYMECLLLESVRMFIGRSFSVPHRALKDSTLNGYFIPKDTMMLINFNPLLMSKEYWGEDYLEFRPERFLRDGKVHTPEHYFPFGLGKHRCIGETLARANVFLFAATLLQSFNFSVVSVDQQPTTDIVDGATPAPKPYKALITHR